MPLLAVKLMTDDSPTDLEAAIAAYQAGAGSALLTYQRGVAMDSFFDPQRDKSVFFVALAHGGLDVPVTKTADLSFLVLQDDSLADLQTSLNAALALVKQAQVADGNTTVAGTVTTTTPLFEAEDVGRKIRIGSAVRTITAYTSATEVDYDNSVAEGGDFSSGTGLTVELLGAEVLQSVEVSAFRERDGDPRFVLMLALGGQVA